MSTTARLSGRGAGSRQEGTITRAQRVSTILMLAVVLAGGCRDRGSSVASLAPWSLNPSVVEAGAGIPFCEAAMARVEAFMSHFEGQAPPSERYGGGSSALLTRKPAFPTMGGGRSGTRVRVPWR